MKIGLPETGHGIIPGWSGTQRVSRRFCTQLVRRMALFAKVFTADQAHALGIVDQVVPTGDGLGAAQAVVDRVLARSPLATDLTKMLINAAEGEEQGRVGEILAGAVAVAANDMAEGLAAFREKRKPRF